MDFLEDYENKKAKRAQLNVPALALNENEVNKLCQILQTNPSTYLLDLLVNRVNPGVDEAAKIKADFLAKIIDKEISCSLIDEFKAIEILSTMLGGYNLEPLLKALENKNEKIANKASEALGKLIFVHDYFDKVVSLAKNNIYAKRVIEDWANAKFFKSRPPLEEKISAIVFRVKGETNTDDLSPASEAFTRSDIPLHAQCMLSLKISKPLEQIAELKKSGREVAYVGDVVGTGSSRKSGINSIQWNLGKDIPFIPNKKSGGIILGSIIAPIFFNTAQDSGALPIVVNVDGLENGDEIEIYPYKGEIYKDGKLFKTFKLSPNTIYDEVRAGGRIPLIMARNLCKKARKFLNLDEENIFIKPNQPVDSKDFGQTLAQKIIAKASELKRVIPGMYVEANLTSVASQDTTGPMTRDEIKELAALKFAAPLVLQSFCHTCAYPKPSDIKTHQSLPKFMIQRGGVSLHPGDGVIHSWINRLILPDTLGTGGDSHTRFPIGLSFPAGSGLVAFGAVSGKMPLNVPESILVKFKGKMQAGITLRDLVNAIPYFAIKKGLLTVEKKNKINIFAGKILEIQGLENLKVEQAFELSDASAERSAAACSVALKKENVDEFLLSNVTLIDAMIEAGFKSKDSLVKRKEKMLEWIENGELLKADEDAKYSKVLEINLEEITEPILACPNDPDDVATLSEILDSKRPKNINEVFVGSCMTNIGHYRALASILEGHKQAKTRLWIAPPTRMDQAKLLNEGIFSIYAASGARIEKAGCSLCMGNQARVADEAIVFSTSTRNFDNRMGKDAKVYLGSAELAGVISILGRIPSKEEYLKIYKDKIFGKEKEIYKYLNFNEIPNFKL